MRIHVHDHEPPIDLGSVGESVDRVAEWGVVEETVHGTPAQG